MAKAYKHQQSFFNKTSFFPLLCRTSKKDVKLRICSVRSSSSSSCDDPSSPKVSCIGQIRRTNKVIGFSSTPHSTHRLTFPATKTTTTTAIITIKTHSLGNYAMLRRWFLGKHVGINAPSTGTGCGSDGGSSKSSCSTRCSKISNHDYGDLKVDVNDLEPPLPVVVKIVNQTSEVNLWKRRCGGGVALKSLEPISR